MQSGGQLSIRADNVAEPVTINGTGPSATGALEAGSDNTSRTFAGPVTLGSDAFIVSSIAGKTLTLTGGIATAGFTARVGGAGDTVVNTVGISGTGGISRTETGTLTINAASNYTGQTSVSSGTLTFTAALGGTSAINLSGGTVNANAAVNAAAAVNVTAGTYNANGAGSLNGTNTVSGAGLLRVTTAVGATGAINVTSGGTLRFDGANTSLTAPSNNVRVDSLGLVHAASGVADLSTQNIVVNPRTTAFVNYSLQQMVYPGTSGTAALNPIDSGSGLLTKTPASSSPLTGPLSFSQSQLDTAAGQPDNYSFAWKGTVTIPKAGAYSFGTSSDDGSVVYIDVNKNGSFSDAGELIVDNNRDQGPHPMTGSVTLAAGTYPIVIGFYENAGGSVMEATNAVGTVANYASQTVINPSNPIGVLVGGGNVQVDAGAELRARTVTGATTTTLNGLLTLTAGTAGSPLASDTQTLAVTNPGGGTANVGANHTLTAQTLTVAPGGLTAAALTKTGAGTLVVSGTTGVALNNSAVVASGGVVDLSASRVSAVARGPVTGLQGLLYVDAQVNPNATGGGAAVNSLLATTPTNAKILTSSNGPNGGLDFRGDADFESFFGQPLVNSNGNHNYTVAFVGKYTAQTTGSHLFGFQQQDDNSAIYVDANQNGTFEDSELVHGKGCCNNTTTFTSGTVNLAQGQSYGIAIVNEETGGGSALGSKFQDNAAIATPTIIAPGATGQNQFTTTAGGGTLQVDPGATLIVGGTDGPVDATVNGTLRYAAQPAATANTLNTLAVGSGQTGTLNVQANQTVTLGSGSALTLTGNLTKTGTGRLSVNTAGIGTGTVTVLAGTLGGTGSIAGPVSVAGPLNSGGTVGPGNSVGTLSTGNFSITSPGGTVAVELDPTNSGGLGTSDNLNVTGAVVLTAGNLAVTLLSPPTAVGQQFQIITNDGTDPVTGAFATVNGSTIAGTTFNAGGYTFSINYASGTGNDVVLTVTAVPEPASLGLLALGAVGILARRRRAVR